MSLSLLAKLLLFTLLAFVSGWAGREYAMPIAAYVSEGRDIKARDARISQRSIAYRIPQGRGLSFAFLQPSTRAKIVIHPAVSERMRAAEKGFVYGIRVRWLDAAKQELSSHDIYLQADSPDVVFASGVKWRFFRTRPELVAEQDLLIVESPSPAASLQIEVIEQDTGIVGIDLRVFEQPNYLGKNSVAAFRRLSEDLREKLAQPNAFPADMLSREERFHLGRNQWRPVGPLGLDGRDYTMLVLYEASREDALGNDSTAIGGIQ